jgi:hypothetical protein
LLFHGVSRFAKNLLPCPTLQYWHSAAWPRLRSTAAGGIRRGVNRILSPAARLASGRGLKVSHGILVSRRYPRLMRDRWDG